MEILLAILSCLVAALIVAVVVLFRRTRQLDYDIMNMRYVKVEKLPEGGYKLTDRTGKAFFEL